MRKIHNKRKKMTEKERQLLKELKKSIFFCSISCLLVIVLACLMFKTNILKPQLNEMTASYISFNNSNTTDMLKISNVKKLSDKKGKSQVNDKTLTFSVTSEIASSYDIVVYPVKKVTDYKNIKFCLAKNNQELVVDNLDNKDTSKDGGIIIYQGKVSSKNKITIRMWLTKKYHQETNNLSFEIKVKPR